MTRVLVSSSRGQYQGVPLDDIEDDTSPGSAPDPEDYTNQTETLANQELRNLNSANQSASENSNLTSQNLEYISFPTTDLESRSSFWRQIISNRHIRSRCHCSKRCQFTLGIVLALLVLIVVPSICAGLGYYSVFVKSPSPVIDKSYHAFSIPDHPVSQHYKAFKTASKTAVSNFNSFYFAVLRAKSRHHDSDSNHRRSYFAFKKEKEGSKKKEFVSEYSTEESGRNRRHSIQKRSSDRKHTYFTINAHHQYHLKWKLQVVFITKDGSDNVFTKEKLDQIHKIEQKIINFPKFVEYCYKDIFLEDPAVKSINGCAPLNSLLSYFYPSIIDGKPYYDGLGMTLTSDINETLKLALSSDHLYYFVDEKMDSSHRKSRLLRTEVLFGAPLHGEYFINIE